MESNRVFWWSTAGLAAAMSLDDEVGTDAWADIRCQHLRCKVPRLLLRRKIESEHGSLPSGLDSRFVAERLSVVVGRGNVVGCPRSYWASCLGGPFSNLALIAGDVRRNLGHQ